MDLLRHQRIALRGLGAALFALLVVAVLCLSFGCATVSGLRQKVEAALPHVDGDLSVELSTIYGASATLNEKNVRWDADRRTVDASELRITSPVGSYVRRITKPAGAPP